MGARVITSFVQAERTSTGEKETHMTPVSSDLVWSLPSSPTRRDCLDSWREEGNRIPGMLASADHWQPVLRFLSTTERYLLSQVCRPLRRLVFSREWETEALKECLRFGFELRWSLRLKPFAIYVDFGSTIAHKRMWAMRSCIHSWHLLRTRVANCVVADASRVPLPIGGWLNLQVEREAVDKEPFLTFWADDKVGDGEVSHRWQRQPAVQWEAAVWSLLAAVLVDRLAEVGGIKKHLVAATLLKTVAEWRERALKNPLDLELWTDGLVADSVSTRDILQSHLSGTTPISYSDLFSWQSDSSRSSTISTSSSLCSTSLGGPEEEPSPSHREANGAWRLQWMNAFANTELRRIVYAKGFRPYVDTIDGLDPTKEKLLTYVIVTVKANVIRLRGTNTCTLTLNTDV
eukprot:Protomagalhaensia_wolfi_Nauph_80__1073@NODE_1625_length_1434_cov_46_321147_g1259_i0_p1_GENE_NODE_1625_length_1434_cov_46_321147_g1259_i0NODE_1625_length_1434_cov_46_321147_g1259_i0_p1_ORF_typecomplete_len404_score47_46Fboxlike/PF12937_7/0_16Fboxlike/PF12937_7/7_5e03Fboxlike/PF12937_7/2_3e03_NODE_1625_length_1434_cov_46_321147_g1259_i0741285